MKKPIFTILVLLLLITGCKSTMNAWSADYKIKKVELGMSKEDVVTVMGDIYKTVGKESHPDGTIESMGYFDHVGGMYRLYIQNGILIKWDYDPGSRSIVENKTN